MRLEILAAAALAVAAPLSATTPARAVEALVSLRPPVQSSVRLLGYGATYVSEGRTLTHHGLDLAAEAGAAVTAPLNGQVVFAGRVPAAGGGTVLAVTIEEPGGLRATLLPIERASVSAGDAVAAGDVVGSLAAAGDASSAAAHLHLGVRRGATYLDPSTMLQLTEQTADGAADVAPVDIASTLRPPASAKAGPPAEPAPLALRPVRAEAPRDAPVGASVLPASRVEPHAREEIRPVPEGTGGAEASPAFPVRDGRPGVLALALSAACAVCAAAGLAVPRLVPARAARKAGA